MRINVVIGAFLPTPPGPAGAIEKVWVRLAASLAAHGHEVTVICRAWQDEPAREEIGGVNYIRTSGFDRTGSTLRDLLCDYKYSRAVRRCLPPADVTVSNCFWLPVLLRGSSEVGLLDHHLQRFPKRQMWLYKHVDRISTVSDVIADAVKAQTPSVAGLLDVVGNPVDTSIFRPLETPANSESGRVLYHGRVHPEKGLDLLVEAIRIASSRGTELELSIVGPYEVERGGGGESYVDRLKKLAEGKQIAFEGNITDQGELADRLRQCDIHCYPSLALRGEASPVAPLEAMACGAVLVVSDLPQFAGYVQDGETGLVFKREGEGAASRLADALVRVGSDDALRLRLRKAGIEKAAEFAVDAIAERHIAAWQKLRDRNG